MRLLAKDFKCQQKESEELPTIMITLGSLVTLDHPGDERHRSQEHVWTATAGY